MLWQVPAFRNYADYAGTDAFRTGLDELRALAHDHCCTIMCAEAVWWRCHRRIIADYFLAGGVSVAHIIGHHKIDPAKVMPGVRSLPGGARSYIQQRREATDPAPPFRLWLILTAYRPRRVYDDCICVVSDSTTAPAVR